MMCEHCHKAPATQVVSVSREGKTKDLSVCNDCAEKLRAEVDGKSALMEMLFGFMKDMPPSSPPLSSPPSPSSDASEDDAMFGMPPEEMLSRLEELIKKIIGNLENLPMDSSVTVSFEKMPPEVKKALSELMGGKPMPFGELSARTSKKEKAKPSVRCPICGMERETLLKNRRFGCADCYATFSEEVGQFMHELQYGNVHCGRVPRFAHHRAKVAAARQELKKAVAANDFLKAATLRDRIRSLERPSVSKEAP